MTQNNITIEDVKKHCTNWPGLVKVGGIDKTFMRASFDPGDGTRYDILAIRVDNTSNLHSVSITNFGLGKPVIIDFSEQLNSDSVPYIAKRTQLSQYTAGVILGLCIEIKQMLEKIKGIDKDSGS